MRQQHSTESELTAFLKSQQNLSLETYARIPQISEDLLKRVQNSKKGTERNNDLLEFFGDRIVNLACALLIHEERFCPDHQLIVGRKITKNDTLGRLAYQLKLHIHARLDLMDIMAIEDWESNSNRCLCSTPPKVLADLFEAFTGAIYEEHGWDETFEWLRFIFTPLIEKATRDYLALDHSVSSLSITSKQERYVSHRLLAELQHQEKLYDYLDFKAKIMIENAEDALSAIPSGTTFIFMENGDIGSDRDMVEIATHLLKFWICQTFMRIYPENREATRKGPHLISSITTLLINSWTLGYLASIISLSSFFDVNDPDYMATNKRFASPQSTTPDVLRSEAPYRSKLTQSLYAMIGWYYTKDPIAAEKWAISWFRPLLNRAHDIITDDPRYQPSLPEGANDTVTKRERSVAASFQKSLNNKSLEEQLEKKFSDMVIKDGLLRTRKSEFKFDINPSHRLIIDLDDDEEEHFEDWGEDRALQVDALPDIEKLCIGSEVLHSKNTVANQKLKIQLRDGSVARFASVGKASVEDIVLKKSKKIPQNIPKAGLSPISILNEPKLEQDRKGIESPLPDITNVQDAHIQNKAQSSNEPHFQKRFTPGSKEIHDYQQPPREPKAMREERETKVKRLISITNAITSRIQHQEKHE